jgi:hypothetical protein
LAQAVAALVHLHRTEQQAAEAVVVAYPLGLGQALDIQELQT